MAFIEIENVSKSYPNGREVLTNINLSIEDGEFVSILGYSGSGKSTLIGMASGLFPATTGQVLIDGQKVEGFANKAAIVFQNYSLLPWFSAEENVRLAVEAAFPDWPAGRMRRQARQYLEMVGLKNSFGKRPSQLSGGMRQRVAIARAFAIEPGVLFLDEPFGALDALTRANLQQELARMCSIAGRPITTLMITNSVEEAILLSDRIIPLSRGPRATLGPAISVSLPKPRNAGLFAHDDAAIHIQARIVAALTGFANSRGGNHEPRMDAQPVRIVQHQEVES